MLKTLFFLAILVACSPFHRKTSDPTVFTSWAATSSHAPIVAVLPFTNNTNQPDLPELVRAGFYGHFSLLPFREREFGEIDRTLEFFEINQKKSFQELSSSELGSLLGVQVLVYGEVTKFTKVYAGVYSQIGVGAKIKMVDSQKGKTIWEDSYLTRFHEGNIPLNQVLAVFSLVKTGLNLRETQELRTIDDLCRNLVARIPKVFFYEVEKNSIPCLCEIQIGSFRDLQRAQELRTELQKKKYGAFIRSIEDRGMVWHRVLIGPFDCGEETEAKEKKIKADFGFDAIPVKIDASIQKVDFMQKKEE